MSYALLSQYKNLFSILSMTLLTEKLSVNKAIYCIMYHFLDKNNNNNAICRILNPKRKQVWEWKNLQDVQFNSLLISY